MDVCFGNLEVIKWLYSIDNEICNVENSNIEHMEFLGHSIFAHSCFNKQLDVVEYLFSIDKNIYNKDQNKSDILKRAKNEYKPEDYSKLLELIVQNI